MNYYNEIDPYCIAWLKNLITAGLIPKGDVDGREIQEVQASELKGYTHCHFFAGIGGWAYAARLAGWPDYLPLWTGSCPCQPFSIIGKGNGFEDPRHLWPYWFKLIRQCRPPVIFGEQVANALSWIDLVQSDLEAAGYACGALDLPAASAGARHQRQRLWFVADSDQARWEDPERITAAEKSACQRPPISLVYSPAGKYLQGPFKPDSSWIVDGIRGEGFAISALGNAIYPPLAAEVIRAYMETYAEI